MNHTENQRDNQDYTIQRHRPHWAQETEQRQRDNQDYTIQRRRLIGHKKQNKDKEIKNNRQLKCIVK